MKTDHGTAPRIVILAAGRSTRLGRPKALARVRGGTLLARTVAVLAPWAVAPIVVVVPPRAIRHRIALRGREVEFAVNHLRHQGLSSSVAIGARRARFAAAVMLLPVDLAQLNRRDLQRLISCWRAQRRRVVARRVKSGAATPLILPKRCLGLTRALVGDEGLKEWVRRLPPGEVRLVDMPSAQTDIDTGHELARARRRARPASTV